MNNQVRLTFKAVDQDDRQKILKLMKFIGLDEVASMHDSDNRRHSHEFHLEGNIKEIDVLAHVFEESEEKLDTDMVDFFMEGTQC